MYKNDDKNEEYTFRKDREEIFVKIFPSFAWYQPICSAFILGKRKFIRPQ